MTKQGFPIGLGSIHIEGGDFFPLGDYDSGRLSGQFESMILAKLCASANLFPNRQSVGCQELLSLITGRSALA